MYIMQVSGVGDTAQVWWRGALPVSGQGRGQHQLVYDEKHYDTVIYRLNNFLDNTNHI